MWLLQWVQWGESRHHGQVHVSPSNWLIKAWLFVVFRSRSRSVVVVCVCVCVFILVYVLFYHTLRLCFRRNIVSSK